VLFKKNRERKNYDQDRNIAKKKNPFSPESLRNPQDPSQRPKAGTGGKKSLTESYEAGEKKKIRWARLSTAGERDKKRSTEEASKPNCQGGALEWVLGTMEGGGPNLKEDQSTGE